MSVRNTCMSRDVSLFLRYVYFYGRVRYSIVTFFCETLTRLILENRIRSFRTNNIRCGPNRWFIFWKLRNPFLRRETNVQTHRLIVVLWVAVHDRDPVVHHHGGLLHLAVHLRMRRRHRHRRRRQARRRGVPVVHAAIAANVTASVHAGIRFATLQKRNRYFNNRTIYGGFF